jgi:hypothetical protein
MKKIILMALASIAIAFSCNAQSPVSTVDSLATQSVVIIKKDKHKPEHVASFYLNRGSNRQLGGILITAVGSITGAAIIAASTSSSSSSGKPSPSLGIGVISISSLIGTILYIGGITDYGMAGRALKYSGQ